MQVRESITIAAGVANNARGLSLSHTLTHTLSRLLSLSLSLSLARARSLSLSLSLFPPPLLRAMRGIPASLSPRCQLPAA
jgi:hypothetical protein